ncbi:MAG: mechanosensitive ion channel family protein [Planctomycetota bacterium]
MRTIQPETAAPPLPEETLPLAGDAKPSIAVEGTKHVDDAVPGAEMFAELLNIFLSGLPEWVRVLAIAVVFAGVAIGGQATIWAVLRRVSRDGGKHPTRLIVTHTARAARVAAVLIGVTAGLGFSGRLGLPSPTEQPGVSSLLGAVITLAITWLVIGVVRGADDMILARHEIDSDSNVRARKTHTQVAVLSRTLMVVIGIFGIGAALMQFDEVERVGTSLLASAGVAGIVLGFAARPVLGNIIAGIQIALTQPIKIGDVVIIEGEWGRIEEITTTYVVLRIWDQRRLIVPFSTIIEQPFENWTRHSTSLLGTIYFYADYSLPIDEVRAELARICEGNPKWDGRVCSVLVTDANDRSIQVRALISAANSSDHWDLRCEVREKLVAFIHREHPGSLPREREEEYTHAAAEPRHG